jgi:hypothetical protein
MFGKCTGVTHLHLQKVLLWPLQKSVVKIINIRIKNAEFHADFKFADAGCHNPRKNARKQK